MEINSVLEAFNGSEMRYREYSSESIFFCGKETISVQCLNKIVKIYNETTDEEIFIDSNSIQCISVQEGLKKLPSGLEFDEKKIYTTVTFLLNGIKIIVNAEKLTEYEIEEEFNKEEPNDQ